MALRGSLPEPVYGSRPLLRQPRHFPALSRTRAGWTELLTTRSCPAPARPVLGHFSFWRTCQTSLRPLGGEGVKLAAWRGSCFISQGGGEESPFPGCDFAPACEGPPQSQHGCKPSKSEQVRGTLLKGNPTHALARTPYSPPAFSHYVLGDF